MRLDDFDPNINVEDQRGSGGGMNFGGGGGGAGALLGLLPMVFSRFGCAGVAVLLLVAAVFGGFSFLGGGGAPVVDTQQQQQQGQTQGGARGTRAPAACSFDAGSRTACNAFSSANRTWQALFQQIGRQYEAPKLVFYSGNGQSGCGAAQSAAGPFYCPTDEGIYLDTSFFDELTQRFHSPGDFAQDYVVAHEFGHHIQRLLGTSERMQQHQQASSSQAEANTWSVRLELQADCYAGVWAARNRDRMEQGDLEEGMRAAQAIGDDTLQRQSQGEVVPDSFTHGTSEQRMQWLRRGLDTGDPNQCDTGI